MTVELTRAGTTETVNFVVGSHENEALDLAMTVLAENDKAEVGRTRLGCFVLRFN